MMTDVETLAPLVGIMAAERTKDRPDLFDDARQEGLIAAWRALGREEARDPGKYARAAARRAVGDVMRGRPAFGAESHRGKQDAHDTSVPLVDDEGRYVAEPRHIECGYATAEGEWLRAAVRRLPERQRRYVFLRFWQGLTAAEIAAELGLAKHTVELMWAEQIRPTLREAVAA